MTKYFAALVRFSLYGGRMRRVRKCQLSANKTADFE